MSSGVSSEYETCEYPSANVRVEYTPPNQHPSADRRDLYSHHAEDLATEVDEDEDDMWPYDGRGLYEHHPKNECGRACFTSCQLRRKFRPRIAELVRFVPRFWGTKLGEKRKMKNSDIPHPPWTLRYRSNDDSLEEDHDDGDLEVWLESVTEKQKLNHGPQLEVCLDGRPDSRIFSF
ncbi:hypothetical protein FRC07_013147 [Ceratobasidium sp. 392]|nr:hypothetical protein FRC07_013147 [Ceratobasidium sp. 392]